MIGKVTSKYGLGLMILGGFWILQLQLTDLPPLWKVLAAVICVMVGGYMFILCGNGKVEK